MGSTEFTITSQLYERSRDCDFLILAKEETCFIHLEMTRFSLKKSDRCLDEYLEISGQKYCGDRTGQNFTLDVESNNSTLVLKHHQSSIFHGSYFGFEIQGYQINCSEHTTTAMEITTTNPDFAIIVENEEVGRTVALETTTDVSDDLVPTPSRRLF